MANILGVAALLCLVIGRIAAFVLDAASRGSQKNGSANDRLHSPRLCGADWAVNRLPTIR
jgi:hypothetical protein